MLIRMKISGAKAVLQIQMISVYVCVLSKYAMITMSVLAPCSSSIAAAISCLLSVHNFAKL